MIHLDAKAALKRSEEINRPDLEKIIPAIMQSVQEESNKGNYSATTPLENISQGLVITLREYFSKFGYRVLASAQSITLDWS